MNFRIATVSVFAAIALLSGCGGDEENAEATTPVTAAPSTTASTALSSSDTSIDKRLTSSATCDPKTLNGVAISSMVVSGGIDCAAGERIASNFQVADKSFEFAVNDYSCFFTAAGSVRKYTCASSNSEIIEFTALSL